VADTYVANDITEGALARPMLRLAWPLVLIQLLQVAYNVGDTIWLGRLSANAVGALGLAFPLIFLLISVGSGFTTAGGILVAQYTGARSERSAGRVAGQTLGFVGLLAVVLGLLGYALTGPMLGLLPAGPETSADVLPLAARYMRLFFLGLPFMFGFFVFASLMRGYGNTRTPLRVMVVSVVVNVVLDPVLIFGVGPVPKLGIEGAALATVLARAVATVVGLYVLFGLHAGPDVHLRHLVPDLEYVRKIVRLGVPSAVEESTSSLAMIILAAVVVTFPPAVVAAYGLGGRIVSLVFLPAMGLGQATNTLVGQNLGADKPERAEEAVWLATKVTAGIVLVIAVVTALFPAQILGIFLSPAAPGAAETIAHGSEFLRIAAVMFVFMGVLQVFLGAYRGAGNTKTALVFSMVTLWVGCVSMTYVLVFLLDWGPTGVWVGYSTGDILGAITAGLWFTRGTWKRAIVDGTDRAAADAGD